jgi:hypothetical protein
VSADLEVTEKAPLILWSSRPVLQVMAREGSERLPKLGKDGQLIEMEMQMGRMFNLNECEDEVVAALRASKGKSPHRSFLNCS